jgi:hypothetical protein
MRESNTRTSKAKKLQTATMKRRARKLKSIEALPTKARNPQARALVVSLPVALDGIVVAGDVNGAGEAVEGELAAALIEQDVGARHGHIVARCLDDAPSAPNAHAGAASVNRRLASLAGRAQMTVDRDMRSN